MIFDMIRGCTILAIIILAGIADLIVNERLDKKGAITTAIAVVMLIYSYIAGSRGYLEYMKLITNGVLRHVLVVLGMYTKFSLLFILPICVIFAVMSLFIRREKLRKASAILVFVSSLSSGLIYTDFILIAGSITAFVFYMKKIKTMVNEGEIQ